MHRRLALVLALLFALVASPVAAPAWTGDFFAGDASGQGIYEDMAVSPHAVRGDRTTFVAFQGRGLDIYVVAFDDDGTVRGPEKAADNPLAGGWDPDDTHGAPALLYDPVRDQLHVFYGAHGSSLYHARTDASGALRAWTALPIVAGKATYPQPFLDDAGMAHLFYRMDQNSDGLPDDTSDTLDRGSWVHRTSSDGGTTWSSSKIVLRGVPDTSWYACYRRGTAGRIHMVATGYLRVTGDEFKRRGVYYAYLDRADSRWHGPTGAVIDSAPSLGVQKSDLTASANRCSVYSATGEYQNQVVVADDGAGGAGLLFLTGPGSDTGRFDWKFARFESGSWVSTRVAGTDHYFDSSTIEYRDGGIDAYLCAGGTRGTGSSWERHWDRGGDIQWWRSEDGGQSWALRSVVATADFDRGVIYNDPQIVLGHEGASPRLVYGEWDNDASNFIHKLYLWGEQGYSGRDYAPVMQRLEGADRIKTAVAVSRDAFPNNADTVVVVGSNALADALAGSPLATSYRAPLLFTPKERPTPELLTEIRRLKARTVIVLGGEASVSRACASALDVGSVTSVQRISGANRYECAAAIAGRMKARHGTPPEVYVASGERFADALALGPLASARCAPILLTRATGLPTATSASLVSLGATRTVVAGGTDSISAGVASRLPGVVRLDGYDRYEVAAAVARLGLHGRHGIPPSLRADRVVVASGLSYADALPGGALAGRVRGPLVLTDSAALSPAASDTLSGLGSVVRVIAVGGRDMLPDATIHDAFSALP